MQATISRAPFGQLPDGTAIEIFSLVNKNGLEAKITNYGGIVLSLKAPDRQGDFRDVVLGFDSLDEYLADNSPYFGCIVGRFGNRIANGHFVLDGEAYSLARNNGPNHLHGGLKGFDKVAWSARPAAAEDGPSLRLTYRSADLEEGYPGNLDISVTYTLTGNDVLRIEYAAVTDKKTVINLTHHSYFNLTGDGSRDVLGHELRIHAGAFIPVDETQIPTGEIRSLDGGPLDFRTAKPIGRDICINDQQLTYGRGFDHCWVLNQQRTTNNEQLTLAAEVFEPGSGRTMEVWTTEPGVQFYSGNFLDGTLKGKGGVTYQKRCGLCLETQHFPDAPNQPDFPSTVLEPGSVFRSVTEYRLSVG